MPDRTLAEHAYELAWTVCGPAVYAGLWSRGTHPPGRLRERRGRATTERPEGPLLLLHAAGRGETTAARALAIGLREIGYAGTLVVTTTSSRSVPALEGLPGVLHQYLPMDDRRSVVRFLDHWRPDAIVVLIGDLWPTLLSEADRRGTPLALCSAALSERTERRWRGLGRGLGAPMFPRFRFALAADQDHADRLERLGVPAVEDLGCLKAAADQLPVDEALVAALRVGAEGRPIVVLASTHDDDEGALLESLAGSDALVVVAPRSPERWRGPGELPRRSRGQAPSPADPVWLADSFGELGSLFEVADVVVMGGSFGARGGHNPAEPARFGRAIVTGPDQRAHAAVAAHLRAAGALVQVDAIGEVGAVVAATLADPALRTRMGAAARSTSDRWQDRRRAAARRVLALT